MSTREVHHSLRQFDHALERLKAAFREKMLPDEEPFLTMLDDRNLSAHVYDFETSRRIFQHIAQQYYTAMHTVAVQLRERLTAQ